MIVKTSFAYTHLEAILSNIMLNLPGHLYWKDVNGVYLGCNDAQAISLGLTDGSQVIGKTDFDLPWKIGDAKKFRQNDLLVIETLQSITVEEPAIVNGKPAIVLTQKLPLQSENGDVLGVLGISLDITARKEAEQAKKARLAMQEQLAHLSRVSSMDTMAVSIAHELNNPLASIITSTGGAERLLADLPKGTVPDSVFTILKNIKAQAERSGKIIHEMKDFMRKDADSSYELVNINQLVELVITFVKDKLFELNIDLHLMLAKNLPNISVNKVQIEQVIVNLLHNAIDAIGECVNKQGVITVRTKLISNNRVDIAIADNGSGMSSEIKQKIFTPFVTNKPHGMGIGLSLCYNIIEAHLGQIEVVSKIGKGTIFHVTLPIHAE